MNATTKVAQPSLVRQLAISWVYLPIVLLACILMALTAWYGYGFRYSIGAVTATWMLLSPLPVLLGPALRSPKWGAAFCLTLAALLLLGNPIKMAMLRMPLSVADLQALPVLFTTMSGMRLAVGIGLAVALLALFTRMLNLQFRTLLPLALAASYVAILPSLISRISPLIETVMPVQVKEHRMFDGEIVRAGQSEEPVAFLQARGPVIYLALDWQNMYSENNGPTREEVASLRLRPWQPLAQSPTRNIHIVLLESLWDTSLLAHYRTNRDPLDPRFRAMWESAGRSYALSPVFGGTTANAEFEVLCGFPSPRNSIAFVTRLRKASPCLPAAMGTHGYRSMASHAHEASNWNRSNAYKEVGFNLYRPIDAFDLDDMEGPYLYDGSFFQQNLQYLEAQPDGKPVFNYQVSLSSHWAFSRNLKARPDLVKVVPADVHLLNHYVNAVAYTTSAFMDWNEAILAKDPDAIIIAFGDHAPVLTEGTTDPDIYKDVNAVDPAKFDSDDTRMQLGMSRTPLLVIDGKNGPVKLTADTPLYELPHLISGLLGNGDLLPQSAQISPMIIRPFLGRLLTGINGTWRNCTENSPMAASTVCVEARKHAETLRILRRDSILGGGYFARRMNAASLLTASRSVGMTIERNWNACTFDVKQFGPQQGIAGKGFNVQPDGSSTIWIRMNQLRGRPIIRVGNVVGQPVYDDKLITTSFDDASLYASTGLLPVTLQCEDEKPILIGQISIIANP